MVVWKSPTYATPMTLLYFCSKWVASISKGAEQRRDGFSINIYIQDVDRSGKIEFTGEVQLKKWKMRTSLSTNHRYYNSSNSFCDKKVRRRIDMAKRALSLLFFNYLRLPN